MLRCKMWIKRKDYEELKKVSGKYSDYGCLRRNAAV